MLRIRHVLRNVQILTLFDATSLGRLKTASIRHNFTVCEVNKRLPNYSFNFRPHLQLWSL